MGAAVHITFSVEGYALPTLADAWATAPSSQRPELEFGARLALVIIGGPSTSALVILWGVALILYGLAVKLEGYSGWLGWTGAVAGAAALVSGTAQIVEPNVFPGALFYVGGTIVSQVWTIVLGVAMCRRAAGCAQPPYMDRQGTLQLG